MLALGMAAPVLAQVCATSGKDGPATVSGVVNTYYPGVSASGNTINVGAARAGGGPALAPGDMVLVMQMQDGVSAANFAVTNTTTYTASAGTSGLFEYRLVADVAGGVITLHDNLTNAYSNAQVAGAPRQTFQVVRVPQYSQVTVTAVVTPLAWNGTTGGIIALDAADNIHLAGTLNAAGYGFRGGAGRVYDGAPGAAPNVTSTVAFSSAVAASNGAMKGEGTAGTPRNTYASIGPVYDWTGQGGDWYPNGDNGWGAPGNAGGGGNDGNPTDNDQNSGGGGGGNGGAGGRGGNTWASNLAVGGRGGRAMANGAGRVVMGGGGGAATSNNGGANHATFSGASGGGIVMVRAYSFSGNGTVNASGATGQTPVTTCCDDGGTGGGGGGTVVLLGSVTTGLGALTVNVRGGNGSPTPSGTADHGPGGGGGGGSIITSAAVGGGSSNIGGTRGAATWNADNGATGTTAAATAFNANTGARSGGACRPNLTVTKTTTTPVRTLPHQTTAEYVVRVANGATSGAAWGVSVRDILPAPFQLQGTTADAALAAASGPATPAASGPSTVVIGTPNGDLSNSYLIRPGGVVTVTFLVSLNGAATGTYQNPATVTFADPTRYTAAGTASPGLAYASGEGNAAGSNYASGSSTGEDVALVGVSVLSLATACPANTSEAAGNLVTNGDFLNTAGALGQGNGVGLAAANTLPANNNVAYQAGFREYTASFAAQAPFPGDPARGIPASANWVYANGNTLAANLGNYWSQQLTGLVPGMSYTFVVYLSSPIRPGTAQSDDPAPRFKIVQSTTTTVTPINGAGAAALPDETTATGDRWILYQAAFTATQTTATLVISDNNNTTAAEAQGNFAIAQPTLRACLSQANLTLTKTNGSSGVVAGSVTSYTLTVANLGPGNAPGTVVTDPAAAGLSCTGITCSSAGTASCPSPLTVTALQSTGLTITPTFNANSTVTFALTCGVTATGQ